MNSSVPLSPPLITAALTRIATIRPTIAQNSLVLNACLVSVARRRVTGLRLRPVRRSAPVALWVAIGLNSFGWVVVTAEGIQRFACATPVVFHDEISPHRPPVEGQDAATGHSWSRHI